MHGCRVARSIGLGDRSVSVLRPVASWSRCRQRLAQDPNSKYKALTSECKALKRQRDALNKRIKNEEKKRARRIERARGLSDADLLSIMASRAAAKAAAAKARAKVKAKGKAKSKANGTGGR